MEEMSPSRRPKRQRTVKNYAKLAEGNYEPDGENHGEESEVEEPKPRKVRLAVPAKSKTLDHQELLGLVLAFEGRKGDARLGSGRRKAAGVRRVKVPTGEKLTDVKILAAENVAVHIRNGGFQAPILIRRSSVESAAKLGMKLPDKELTVQHLADLVGPDHLIPTVDVSTQAMGPTYDMAQWEAYWAEPSPRRPLLCGEALGLGETRMAEAVSPPAIVAELDLVRRVWPREELPMPKPPRQLHVQMSASGSCSDFHILPGGAAQWQHVVRGRKVLLVAPPSAANLLAFEHWASSSPQEHAFLAERLVECQKVDLQQGDTLLLPGGWLRCEATPVDCTLLGGNFLTGYNLDQHLEIWNLETRLRVHAKQRFPLFKTIHWHAARWYLKQLKDEKRMDGSSADVSQWERAALPALVGTLKAWLRQSRDGREASGAPWSSKEAASDVAALEALFPPTPGPASATRRQPVSDSPNRIRLLIRTPMAVARNGSSATPSRSQRHKEKKKDDDFVTGEEFEHELGSEDGEEGGDAGVEDEEVREEDLGQASEEDEPPEDGDEEAEEEDDNDGEWGASNSRPLPRGGLMPQRRGNRSQLKPASRQLASPRPAATSARTAPCAKGTARRKAKGSVRERLLARMGADPRGPLPTLQKYTRPLVRKAQPGEAPPGGEGGAPT